MIEHFFCQDREPSPVLPCLTETQDKATLIDAGELNISDMGSMGGRNQKGKEQMENSGMQEHPADFISGSPQILKFVG